MRRTVLLTAVLVFAAPACVGSRGGGGGPAPRSFQPVPCVPPPTSVQFFNGTNHGPVKVWKGMDGLGILADVSFGVRDAAGNLDEYGLDDQTLLADIHLHSNQSAEQFTILLPSHRPTPGVPNSYVDVNVDGDYKTISLTFTASVGGKYPDAPVHLQVPDQTQDDIIDQTMQVHLVDVEEDGLQKTRITVKVKYKDHLNVLHDLEDHADVIHE